MSNVVRLDGTVMPLLGEELYLQALRFIINGKEEKASCKLNQVRDWLRENGKTPESLMPDLTMQKFMGLYGDYKYNEACRKKHQFDVFQEKLTSEWDPVSTPWIQDDNLLEMIVHHVAELGDLDDSEDCVVFLQKVREIPRVKIALELAA